MNLETHIRDIWIAVGVLSALGIFLGFVRTTIWQSRTTKISIELVVNEQLLPFSREIFLFRQSSNSLLIYVISSLRSSSSLWLVFHYGG